MDFTQSGAFGKYDGIGAKQDFFSIDGGKTSLGTFNTTKSDDNFADWSIKEGGDADGGGIAGTKSSTLARHIIEMAVPATT